MRFAHLKIHHGSERMRLRGLSGAGEALSSLGIGGVLITNGGRGEDSLAASSSARTGQALLE
jgi:hypothetical protein